MPSQMDTSAFRCRGLPGRTFGIWLAFAAITLPSVTTANAEDNRGIQLLSDFRQADEQLREIFDGTSVVGDIGGRASQFAARQGTRYALVAFPVRGSIKPERIGKPYCRSRLLTPEQTVFEDTLSRQVTDKLVFTSMFKSWRSRGKIVDAKVLTRRIADEDYAVTLCLVADQGVTSAPVTITPSDIVAARVAVAGALFADAEYKHAARRYREIFEDTDNPDMLVSEVVSALKAGDLEAGFARDELLIDRLDEVTNPDLLATYETVMEQAVAAYMTIPDSTATTD